jgi:hypothetical protein
MQAPSDTNLETGANSLRFGSKTMQVNNLQQLAKDFGATAFPRKEELHKAENLLIGMALTGQMADCSAINDKGDKPNEADTWGEDRHVRAELISWLCTDAEASKHVHHRGIRLSGADIVGNLDLSFASIPFPLTLRFCRLTQLINLTGAQLTQLDLGGSAISGILAEDLAVKQNIYLNDVTCKGEIRLSNARVGDTVDCSGGTFANPYQKELPESGIALRFPRIRVEGHVQLVSVRVTGAVWLLYSQIDGNLDCSGGSFKVPPEQQDKEEIGTALSAEWALVKAGILLRDGFTAVGYVDLSGVHIGETFWCENADFQNADLDLTNASATALYDSGWNDPRDASITVWPEPGHLTLDGFTYERISSLGQINVEKRLDWLGLQPQPPFRSQPYLQLAKVLEDSGYADGRLQVLVHMEYLRRKYQDNVIERPLSTGYEVMVGYGYHPLWAVGEILGLSALGWIIYRRSYLVGGIVPKDKEAYEIFRAAAGGLPGHYPNFSPLVYSLENSIPLVKLGQADCWQPDPAPKCPIEINRAVKLEDRGLLEEQNTKNQQNPALDHEVDAGQNAPPAKQALTEKNSLRLPFSRGATANVAPPVSGIKTERQTATVKSAPRSEYDRSRPFSGRFKRLLIATGLNSSENESSASSFWKNFGTSPRFVTWFQWFQILLGWLLATLFVAGISGIVHKE